tara:strand:+ start:10658 stop:10978 length:321 start_codon:yes stop_codon:yes gene_type:complete
MTKKIENKLTNAVAGYGEHNKPYLKLFNPCGAATWLLSEYDSKQRMFFGLCDLGMGSPELGYVSLDELLQIRLPMGLKIERDMSWEPEHTLIEYARKARECGSIQA